MQFDRRALKRNMNKTASTYQDAAKLAKLTGEQLLTRLDYIKCAPQRILDLGAGTGALSLQLAKRYPKAEVIACDLAEARMQIAKRQRPWFSKIRCCTADMELLPFHRHSFDLIISNQCLYWSNNLKQTITEMARVLKPGGVLLFSSLGPDTLIELRQSFAKIDQAPHVHLFLDMHEIGDLLLKAGFKNPVMDVDRLKLSYPNLPALIDSLRNTGEVNYHIDRNKHLSGKVMLADLNKHYPSNNESSDLSASVEVIYGHAWGNELQQSIDEQTGEVRVSLDSLVRKKP